MIPRFAHALVLNALEDTRVVMVVGPRQAGKTTLVSAVAAAEHPMPLVTLDDAPTRARATRDPVGFLAGLERPLAIDEVQRAPELLLEIKRIVDRDTRPGRFLLTGSAQVLSLPHVADALVGRVEVVTLSPLAQSEIEGVANQLVDRLFDNAPPRVRSAPAGTSAWLERALAGGFPEALDRTGPRRGAWFSAYVDALVQRDVRDLATIRALDEIPALLGLIASRAGGLLNYSNLANDLRVSEASVRRYVALLEATFAVRRIPAWRRNVGKRAVSTPKCYPVDSGLAAHLLGLDPERIDADPALAGGLLEGFGAMELVRLCSVSEAQPRAHHFRARSGAEVDVLLEGRGGRVVGVEVKASAVPEPRDFRGLELVRDGLGDRFVAGILLHAGEQTLPFGDRLWSVPVSALWSAPTS